MATLRVCNGLNCLFFEGLEKIDDEPIIIHEHQYATESTDGKMVGHGAKLPKSPQKSHVKLTESHVSDESTPSELRPNIKVYVGQSRLQTEHY